jgi:hypothetical protein
MKYKIIIRPEAENDLEAQPDRHIDALWREEVENRIIACMSGKIRTVSLKEVLSKYNKQPQSLEK